ncbi:toxin-antitoxin system TumE family protein [Ampullimonas aquatilis]|uniref:toxin-antitoxin system TumE family protein n=1 Tax=Ampullimonas aquatilis TaxID=1341549 RepID=UPI003C793982
MNVSTKATLLYADKAVLPDGCIIELRIWQLPSPDPERAHGLKYSLFYGCEGRRIVGYDNERGKGDHRHLGATETPYTFTTVEQLIADFLVDVEKERNSQ